MAYPESYQQLVAIADDVHNVISQIRTMITFEEPYRGSTDEQNRAYIDLERLTCDNVKDVVGYMNEFRRLAAKSGRMYISEELSEKFFKKMPPLLGKELEAAFKAKHPANTIGVLPRIHFSYQYMVEMCKRAALQRSMKDLTFCSKIPLPGYYNQNKRYGLRKAKTYKGKPHDTHLRTFRRKDSAKQGKCKCYVCGEEGHFARDCDRKRGNIARKAIMDNLNLPEDWDVLSVDLNEPDSDAICSVSEGEGDQTAKTLRVHQMPYEEEAAFMLRQSEDNYGYRYKVPLPSNQETCQHTYQENGPVQDGDAKCSYCHMRTNQRMRIHCTKCKITACPMCASFHCKFIITPVPPPPKNEEEVIHGERKLSEMSRKEAVKALMAIAQKEQSARIVAQTRNKELEMELKLQKEATELEVQALRKQVEELRAEINKKELIKEGKRPIDTTCVMPRLFFFLNKDL